MSLHASGTTSKVIEISAVGRNAAAIILTFRNVVGAISAGRTYEDGNESGQKLLYTAQRSVPPPLFDTRDRKFGIEKRLRFGTSGRQPFHNPRSVRIARHSGAVLGRADEPFFGLRVSLTFLTCAGRRSAHFRMASSAGHRDCPHDVRLYSTLGGTCG
jgi:hypothetical protein